MSDSLQHFDETRPDTKEWVLEAETEYRFELDPGSSLTIKVCCGGKVIPASKSLLSWLVDKLKSSAQNLQKGKHIFSEPNARPPSSPGRVVP